MLTLKTTELRPLAHSVDIVQNALLNPIQPRPFEQEFKLEKVKIDIDQSIDRRFQDLSHQIRDLRADIIEKVEKKTPESITETWAQRLMKGMDSANRALGPTLRKAEAEEINHKSQNFVVSNFIYERGMDIKQAL